MPFLGKDCRGPGLEWIKTNKGWDVLNEINNNLPNNQDHICGSNSSSQPKLRSKSCSTEEQRIFYDSNYKPSIIVRRNITKENLNLPELSEVLSRLDFREAVKDIRRFAYICQFISLLLKNKMHLLGGRAQIEIVDILETIYWTVRSSQCNQHILRSLLCDFENCLVENQFDHVGSKTLWQRHTDALKRMRSLDSDNADHSTTSPTHTNSEGIKLPELPSHCLACIYFRLTSVDDMQAVGRAHPWLRRPLDSDDFWQHLVRRRFSSAQLKSVQSSSVLAGDCGRNWEQIYVQLMQRFGRQMSAGYCVQLVHCAGCLALYWPICGHVCGSDLVKAEAEQLESPAQNHISPEELIVLLKI